MEKKKKTFTHNPAIVLMKKEKMKIKNLLQDMVRGLNIMIISIMITINKLINEKNNMDKRQNNKHDAM